VGGKPENVLPAAVAIELVHNFTLVHDDIMDEADLRRGLATVHKKWGVPKAIIAEMLYIQRLLRYFHAQGARPVRLVESLELMSKTCTDICEGQWGMIYLATRKDVTEAEYMRMVEKKTAVLFARVNEDGRFFVRRNNDIARALWDFGRMTGIGFQIYDECNRPDNA